jgi:hypothetical protein
MYSTVVITVKGSQPAGGYPVATPSAGMPGKPEGPTGTSTLTSTSTSTKYITVKPTPTGSVPVGQEGTPVGGSDKPSGSSPAGPAGGNGEDCAVPVTVTVTAKETVTVTAGQSVPTSGAGYPAVPAVPENASSAAPVKPSGGAGMPPKPSAPAGGMYPITNGTNPYPAGPTGFKTSAKPSVPVGTAVPSKPVETSLPYFSFVSEAATPTPQTTPAGETASTPVAASTPAPAMSSAPAGGEYGNGYGAAPVSSPAASSPVKPAETPIVSSKTPEAETKATPAPTPSPVGNGGYGSGYGTY